MFEQEEDEGAPMPAYVEALKRAQVGAAPMENPQAGDGNGTIFVDKSLFKGDCKVGDQVKLLATITNKGSKIGLTPQSVEYITSDELGSEEAEPRIGTEE